MSGCDNFDFEAPQDEFGFMDGLRGADGTTFYPHVSAEGVLSWTNDGGKPNPDPVNIKGADGKSAYAAAVQAGFTGTEAEFNTYLSGIGVLTQEVADQKSALTAVENKVGTPVDTSGFGWESGSYNATTGSPGASNNAIRCTSFPFAIKDSVINLETDESGYSLRVIEMDSATETGATHVLVTHNQVQRVVVQNDSYLRIVLLKTGIGSDTSKAQYVKMHLWSRDNIAYLQSEVSVKAGVLRDTASGAVASFVPDETVPNLLGLDVNIEPVQDLHGFDEPWPGGAKVSKCPTFANGTHTLANGVTITIQDGKITINGTPTAAGYWEESIQPTVIPDDAYITFNNPVASQYVAIVFMSGGRNAAAPVPALANRTTSVSAASGQTIDALRISFNGQGTFSNFELSPIVHLGSTPKPYSQYSNICPISGWNAVDVETSCANIWDEQWVTGSIGTDGADIASSNGIRSANYCRCAGDTEYSFVQPAGITARVYWYGKTKNFISRSSAPREGSQAVVTSPANAYWYRIQVGDSSYRYPTYNNDIALNYPATETEYRTHVGTTYTIQLGQMVYGATLDAINGTLTVDSAKYAYQGTEAAVLAQQGTYGYRIGFELPSTARVPTTTAERLDAISNIMVANADVVTATRYQPGQFELYPRTSTICACLCVVPLEYDTTTLAKQWLADNGFEVVYRLATPIEISLDPVTIATIAGQTNNVWADAGDVSVEYAADIKAYIDRLNQPIEEDMVANNLIQSGKYFTINNRLFLSTASIAVGAQIIPGTNCTETSLAEALNALNA